MLLVWNAATGRLVRRVDREGLPTTSLTIDVDGSHFAAGSSNGEISVWPLPDGDPRILPAAVHTQVLSVAFDGATVKRGNVPDNFRLLAGSYAGGNVVIWDLARNIPQAYCHGAHYAVNAVAFSPDGMTLATTGRGFTGLWDTTTGRPLVVLQNKDFMNALAFAPDGRQLAVSSVNAFGGEGGVQIWRLETGRGIETLRGLTAPVSKVCIAPSIERVAALSHNWQIAVWNMKNGFLERVFNAPEGISADNAAVEFSPDGRQLAFAAGQHARLWDLSTGEERGWRLPQGLCDSMAFDHEGKSLFLFRAEREEIASVCRLRNLLAARPESPLWENSYFDGRVHTSAMTRDAAYVVVAGERGRAGARKTTRLFRTSDGADLTANESMRLGYELDTSGKVMAIENGTKGADLLELPSGRQIDRLGSFPTCLSPGAVYVMARQPNGFGLYRRHDELPLVTLGMNVTSLSMQAQFSSDGKRLAWGNVDGSVFVCEIEELRRQLSEFGLAW
jgi:WD40 repeat protein